MENNGKRNPLKNPVSYFLAGLILIFGALAVFAIYSVNGFSHIGRWLKRLKPGRAKKESADEE